MVAVSRPHFDDRRGFTAGNSFRFNPLLVTHEQAALLLYCFIDNDALVVQPLFEKLLTLPADCFDERAAGELIPDILRAAITSYRNSPLTVEDRERLAQLDKVATNVERWRGRPSVRETAADVFEIRCAGRHPLFMLSKAPLCDGSG